MTKLSRKNYLPSKEDRHKLFGSVAPGPRTKPTTKNEMVDLQNLNKDFLFDIDAVGVSNVKYPVLVNTNNQTTPQSTIGTFKLTSNISRMSKGTNMSRFLEEIENTNKKENGFQVTFPVLKQFTKRLQQRLEQDSATIEVTFPWFYERKGPKSNLSGFNHANVTLITTYNIDGTTNYKGSMSTMITTLCPCSKEISEYSAHSQRGIVTMDVELTDDVVEQSIDWMNLLLEAAESNASAMIHPVLKRIDEKQVTENAYENPRFVEDIVRLVAADLYEIPFVSKFSVTCRNEESIHMHDAIATINFDKNTNKLK